MLITLRLKALVKDLLDLIMRVVVTVHLLLDSQISLILALIDFSFKRLTSLNRKSVLLLP